MMTKRVTETWEYYRDNCSGFKEPMRKRFRELDEYVAGLEELCADMWPIARSGVCIDRCARYGECIRQYDERGCMLKQKMDELGIPHE